MALKILRHVDVLIIQTINMHEHFAGVQYDEFILKRELFCKQTRPGVSMRFIGFKKFSKSFVVMYLAKYLIAEGH